VTDTVRCGDIEGAPSTVSLDQSHDHPVSVYHQDEEMDAIKNSIADPDIIDWAVAQRRGAYFIPHTLKT